MKNRFSDSFDIHARINSGEIVLVCTTDGNYYRLGLGRKSYVSWSDVCDAIENKAHSDRLSYKFVEPSFLEIVRHAMLTQLIRIKTHLHSRIN